MYKKYYWEKYAQLSLPYCNINYEFICEDKPDLQTEDDIMGVEVVQVKTESEGKKDDALFSCLGENMTAEQVKSNGKIKSANLGENIKAIGNSWMTNFGFYNVEQRIAENIQTAKDKIIDKINKKNNYKQFKKMGIYLIFEPQQTIFINEKSINVYKKIVDGITQNANYGMDGFDLYIIDFLRYIFVNNSTNMFEKDDVARNHIHKQALEYEESKTVK